MPQYERELLVRCGSCDLVYVRQLPSPAELSEYYAAYPAMGDVPDLTLRRFGELLDRLEPYRQTGRLLDVGCGDGHFLAAARDRGWTTYGSEYGDGPRERARQRGLDVRPAPFAAAPDEMGAFDVVTSIEVIEHVPEPRDEVARMVALVRPGGCLYVTTPNFNSLSRRILGPRWRVIEYPEHLNLFTPRTLDYLLTRAGLEKAELRTTGMSPADIRAGLRPPAADAPSTGARDERLRSQVARSPALGRGVGLANAALSGLGLGDTLKASYRLP
jgi:2-polyprenyl-3-methyl-5-hydroxy-6-metoxy-1,4-benzoquinol methylase